MTSISRSKDCGNSPKNKFAEDIAIAIETCDFSFLQPYLDSTFLWHRESGTSLDTDGVEKTIVSESNRPTQLQVFRVITHGKAGAVNGISESSLGKKNFCHVIEFTNTKCSKIGAITSYVHGTYQGT